MADWLKSGILGLCFFLGKKVSASGPGRKELISPMEWAKRVGVGGRSMAELGPVATETWEAAVCLQRDLGLPAATSCSYLRPPRVPRAI